MTAGYEQITWICTRDQTTAKLLAASANKSSSGEVPYLRQIRTFRVSGMNAVDVVPGDVVVDCFQRRMIVTLTDHRPDLPWSMITAVYLRAVAVGTSARGVVCSISRPADRVGLDARREDQVEHHDVECVFTRSTNLEQSEETTRTPTAQDICHLERSVASKLRNGWSIWDGATRWRVDRVADLERLDRLPYAVVTATGLA